MVDLCSDHREVHPALPHALLKKRLQVMHPARTPRADLPILVPLWWAALEGIIDKMKEGRSANPRTIHA